MSKRLTSCVTIEKITLNFIVTYEIVDGVRMFTLPSLPLDHEIYNLIAGDSVNIVFDNTYKLHKVNGIELIYN